jgi:uncharacterized protein (UPF0332 family)
VSAPREIAQYVARARRSLEVAQRLLLDGYPGECASRAYYAMFYAAQALLKSEDVDVTKHSAVEAAFGERFAKTARLDPRLHRMLIGARKEREIADYVLGQETSPETAAGRLRDATEFVEVVTDYLQHPPPEPR